MRTLFTAVRSLTYAAGFVFLWSWLGWRLRPFDRYMGSLPEWMWPAGMLLMIVGGTLALMCFSAFIIHGQGTTAPFDAPRVFVAVGPYRYTRNPMYIGAISVLMGVGLYVGSAPILALALAFWGVAHLFVVFYEEPVLNRKFDGIYSDYCRRVFRWLPHSSS